MRLQVWSSDCSCCCHGLREDEGVDGSEPRGVSGATQAESQRVSPAGFLAGLEISGLRSRRTESSLRGSSQEAACDGCSARISIPWIEDFAKHFSRCDIWELSVRPNTVAAHSVSDPTFICHRSYAFEEAVCSFRDFLWDINGKGKSRR